MTHTTEAAAIDAHLTLREQLVRHGPIAALAAEAELPPSTVYSCLKADSVHTPSRVLHRLAVALNGKRSIGGDEMTEAWLVEAWKRDRDRNAESDR